MPRAHHIIALSFPKLCDCVTAKPHHNAILQLCDTARDKEYILRKTPHNPRLCGALFERETALSVVPNISSFGQAGRLRQQVSRAVTVWADSRAGRDAFARLFPLDNSLLVSTISSGRTLFLTAVYSAIISLILFIWVFCRQKIVTLCDLLLYPFVRGITGYNQTVYISIPVSLFTSSSDQYSFVQEKN